MITKPGQDVNHRNQSCWERDQQTQAMRVELGDESSYVFPYHRLAFVRLESGDGQDILHVVLDTHEIQITGKHLREMAIAFQKFSVEWVRKLPARYDAQADDGHAWITSITVNETSA